MNKKKKKNEEQRSQKGGDFNRVERGKSVKWEREEPPLLKPLFLLAHSNLQNQPSRFIEKRHT